MSKLVLSEGHVSPDSPISVQLIKNHHRVDKILSDSAMATDDIQILISYALWSQWGQIAVEREGTAWTARAELVATCVQNPSRRTPRPRHGQWVTDALSRPSRPSFGSAAMPGHLSSTEVRTDE